MAIRSMILAIGCFIHLKKDGKNVIDFPRPLGKYIFMRSIFGFLSSTSFYLSIDYLNLSMAVSLYYTSPIITAIICYFFLGEKIGKFEILGIFSAMFGVVILTQPKLIFPNLNQSVVTVDNKSH